MGSTYDFSGWATKNNLMCADGRTICRDAFKDNDGQTVPLVWNHQHNDPNNILGHAVLENRDEGVYAYCVLNDTEAGNTAKQLIKHGDIDSMSIWANQLKQKGANVMHGVIREVSLVLAGANPGALIDSVIAHGEMSDEEAVIYTDEHLELIHADTKEEIKIPDTEEKKDDPEKEPEKKTETKEKTVGDIINAMTEEQQNAVYAVVGMALSDTGDNDGDETDLEKTGGESMKHNVFDETQGTKNKDGVLSHDAMVEIISDANRFGSLKESFIQHADTYGITNIDYMFPDAKTLNNAPDFISREMEWVSTVMNATHHSPFSRVKSIFADITEDDARAKGYIKGNLKKEEVFSLLKRTTTPTTVYKKQKLDRDDIVDITDFDVVAWLKTEMRMMLDEELARAILVGDGRLASSDDKINETAIRPIWTDADLYTIKYALETTKTATGSEKAKAFIKGAIKSRKEYRGSGNPSMYMTEDMLTDCLLLEDTTGRVIYDSIDKLATTLRVSKIITVPVMDALVRNDSEGNTYDLEGIMVNLTDYNVGADKGGAVNMFDDFDINYNQQKYLIETRCSGALIKPYSAIALEIKTAKVAG